MKKFLQRSCSICLAFMLFACPMSPEPSVLQPDTSISQLTAGEVTVAENSSGHFVVPLETSVTEISITIISTDSTALVTIAKAGTPVLPAIGNTFMLTGLAIGENPYVITVETEDGTSSKDYPLVITRAAPPPIVLPDSIVLSSPADQAEGIGVLPVLSWELSKNAVYWRVFFEEGTTASSEATSGEYFLFTPEWVPPLDLEPNTTYAWKVIPYKTNGLPMASSETRTFVTGNVPSTPVALTVSPVESQPHLVLQWEGAEAAEGYKIYRNSASTPFVVSAAGTDLTWIDTAPVSGLNVYEVWAFNSFGNSVSAAQAQGTPGSGGSIVIIFK